jgi:DNA polymerase III epsilon subunit-like protein
MKKVYMISVDFETTGLSKEDHLTQVAVAIRTNRHGEDTQTYASYIYTDRPIPDKIVELTRITTAMVLTAPKLETVLQQIKEFIDAVCVDENGVRVVIAYNGVSFDIPMLTAAMRRIWQKDRINEWWRALRMSYLFDPMLYLRQQYPDDCRWSRRANGNACLKLGDVHKSICKTTIDGAHDALNDCTAVLRVMEDDIFTPFECAVRAETVDEKHTKNICRFVDHMLGEPTRKKKHGRTIADMLKNKRVKS